MHRGHLDPIQLHWQQHWFSLSTDKVNV